jgi:hypothetical protein
MTIVRKKQGITNNNKSSFQNGGSVKGSAPSAPKQDYGPGKISRGATATAKGLKTGAIGAAKVTGGIIAAPFALASAGIGLGVGAVRSIPKALLTTGKTALKSVTLGAQSYLAGRSRKKLREKLGVAYPESVTALANFAARKKSINNAHKRHMEHLSKHAPTLSTRTWYGKSLITKKNDGTLNTSKQDANTAKKKEEYERQALMYQKEKDKQTEILLSKMSTFHRKKGLGGITSYKTSWFGRSKRGEVYGDNDNGQTMGHKDLLSTPKSTNESMDDYFADRLKQSQTNLSKSYEYGKEKAAFAAADFKQTDPKYKLLAQTSINAKQKSNTAKTAYDAAKSDYEKSVTAFTGPGKDYASEGKKIILNRYLDEYKAAVKKTLEAEQDLQKATPKDISHYESKYYQRLQNVQNTKNSIKKNWTKLGQTLKNKVRSSTFVMGNTIYGKKNNKSKIQPTTPATPLAGSDYGLRARLGLGEFGISPFTSKLEKSDKIEEVLFKNKQKQISQLTSEISELTSNIETLRQKIAEPIDPNATTPVDKNELLAKLQESQANLQTLSADKLTRQNLLSRAKITILKLKDEANFDKNIKKLNSLKDKDKAKYSTLLEKIEEKNNTNNPSIILELDSQIKKLATEYKRKSGEEAVKVLRELQIMKQLKRYYNADLTQSKIDDELKLSNPTVP